MLVLALFLRHACGWKIKGSPAVLFSMQIMYANIPTRCQLLYNKLRLCSSFGSSLEFKKSVLLVKKINFCYCFITVIYYMTPGMLFLYQPHQQLWYPLVSNSQCYSLPAQLDIASESNVKLMKRSLCVGEQTVAQFGFMHSEQMIKNLFPHCCHAGCCQALSFTAPLWLNQEMTPSWWL